MIVIAIVGLVILLAVGSAPSHDNGTATAASDGIGIVVMLMVAAFVFVLLAGGAGMTKGHTFGEGVSHYGGTLVEQVAP
jgi:hypothetical protein